MASTEFVGLQNLDLAQASGYDESYQARVHSRHSRIEEREHSSGSLPRADGGKDAWWFLAGCFLIEALTWGKHEPRLLTRCYCKSYPFHNRTSNHPPVNLYVSVGIGGLAARTVVKGVYWLSLDF